MTKNTLHKLIGTYISNLSPEAKGVIEKMYNYRYASRPEGEKPPKVYPPELEKEIIDIITMSLQNRLKYIEHYEMEH